MPVHVAKTASVTKVFPGVLYDLCTFLCKLMSSADNLCKQFDTLMVFLKEFFENVDFEKKISR